MYLGMIVGASDVTVTVIGAVDERKIHKASMARRRRRCCHCLTDTRCHRGWYPVLSIRDHVTDLGCC